jgi:type I restriction enzyme S subunit
VRKGAVAREGYKKTELGWIPEDWEVKRLGELAEIKRGASPRPIADPKYFDINSKVGWVRISDVSKSKKYLLSVEQYLSELGIKNSRFVPQNSLIMSICASIGKPICTQLDTCIHDGFVVFESLLSDQEFLYYYLSFIQNTWHSYSQPGTQLNLNTGIINIQKLPLPPLPEQKKIAEILSTWDEAIEKLNSYIEAKKKLKKALMQRLLTGKQRFKEFVVIEGYKKTELGWIPEDWEVKRLGELGSFLKGKGIKKDEISNQGLPCIRYGEIYTQHHEYIKNISSFISKEIAESSQKIDIGTILFAASGETKEEIGKCVANTQFEDIYAGGDIIIFSPCLLTNDPMFLGFLLNVSFIQSQKSKVAQGDSIVHIYSSSLEKIKIPLPPLLEQKKIAEILSKADEEIDLLNQELEKLKMQKKGLMQKLLAGAWRVKL